MEKNVYEQALKVFNMWEIEAKPLELFYPWVVSADGDVVNLEERKESYPIYSNRLSEDDWLEHIKIKSWYEEQDGLSLEQALTYAREIVGLSSQLQDETK